MPHLPFTPNHILLISACYPNSAALLAPKADFKPNNQELSRLTYYAANRPGKINKLGSELEKRAVAEARKAKTGNVRARATLLVTLSIFKAVVTECRRDLSLLASSPVIVIEATLSALPSDLEVAARAASLFTAWTTYTDGNLMGVDMRLTESYMSSLKVFASMTGTEGKTSDQELRNRTRLVGLSALVGAVASEALYGDSTQFLAQARLIMDAVVSILLYATIETLDEESVDLKRKTASPAETGFRPRPVTERRAVSVYAHVDGQEGPSGADVTRECLQTLYSLLSQANATQVGAAVQATLDSIEQRSGWEKPEHCSWLAERIVEWTQYQYRYAVPSLLVERLLEVKDTPTMIPAQRTMIEMVTTIFSSPTPLNNLSTSDIISNLISILLRRVDINQDDDLLPQLVECIASMGTHIYYADQIQDLVGELISRLLLLEMNNQAGQRKLEEGARSQAIRCLLHGLVGLIRAADKHVEVSDHSTPTITIRSPITEKPPILLPAAARSSEATIKATIDKVRPHRSARRTKVEAQVWQDTLTLLCDGDYGVRADYVDALIAYLNSEASKDGEFTDADGVRRIRRLVDGPTRQASALSAIKWGDPVTHLLNAVHAYLYMLITTEALGQPQGIRTPSRSSRSIPNTRPPSHAGSDAETNNDSLQATPQPSKITTRSRKTSMTKRMMQNVPPVTLTGSSAATASDYAQALSVMVSVHEQLPVRGLLTGVPMLLALGEATQVDETADAATVQRVGMVRELLAKVWLNLGRIWDRPDLCKLAEQALAIGGNSLPNLDDLDAGRYHAAREAIPFAAEEASSPGALALDGRAAIRLLASCPSAQDATAMDEESLLSRLTSTWNIETALQSAFEPEVIQHSDPLNAVHRLAPALMHIENLSLASLNAGKRGVGVTDLREALSGRNSMSNAALSGRAPSVVTADHVSSILPDLALRPVKSRGDKKRMVSGPSEVRDVLSKLGIGSGSPMKSNGTAPLRAPMISLPQQTSPAVSVPPYNS